MRTVFLLVLAGCNSSPGTSVEIRASDYDQSCTQASDCMMINEGSCCPQCQFGAINKSARTAYQDAAKKRQDACMGVKCALPPCASPALMCSDGKCALCLGNCFDAGPPKDAATDAPGDAPADAPKD